MESLDQISSALAAKDNMLDFHLKAFLSSGQLAAGIYEH